MQPTTDPDPRSFDRHAAYAAEIARLQAEHTRLHPLMAQLIAPFFSATSERATTADIRQKLADEARTWPLDDRDEPRRRANDD